MELPLIWHFAKKKEKIALKSTVTAFVFLWLIFVADFINAIQIPYVAFLLLVITFFLHSFAGYFVNLYNKVCFFDRFMHVFGTFAFAIFIYYFLSNFLDYGGSKSFLSLNFLLMGISAGAFFEIYEFFFDMRNSKKLQRGLRDTDVDIICDILGSIGATALAYFVLL